MEQALTVQKYEQLEAAFFEDEAPKLLERGLTLEQLGQLHILVKKKITIHKLNILELEAQKILLDLKKNSDASITVRTTELTKYDKIFKKMRDEVRIPFTNFIKEKQITPVKMFEDRVDPEENKDFKEQVEILKKQRLDKEKLDKEQREKEEEKAKYISHVHVQNLTIEKEYFKNYSKYIDDTYTDLLSNLAESPDLEVIKNYVSSIEIPLPQPFKERLLTIEDKVAIYNKLIEEKRILGFTELKEKLKNDALKFVEDTFKMYQVELNNAKNNPKIVEEIKKNNEVVIAKKEEILDTNINIEKVYSTVIAETTKPEGKSIKRYYEVENENSFEFALKIMDCFKRIPNAREYVADRKDWDNFNVKSMRNAIAEYSTKKKDFYPNLKYKLIEE